MTSTSEGRRKAAGFLEAAWPLVEPWAESIQSTLRADPLRDDHPLVEQLRGQWGDRLASLWGDFHLEAALDDYEQKEYRYDEN